MLKTPVTGVGGISTAVRTESTRMLSLELFVQQTAVLSHLNDRVIEAIEALRQLAGAKPESCRCRRTQLRRERPSL
jgi:hypothetical protein